MLNIFQNPDESKIQRYKRDILTYLEDQTISPYVLKRLFFKFPQNAEFIIRKILDRSEFSLEKDFDSLMDEFKPSFKGKRIYPCILPMSPKFVRTMEPKLYRKTKTNRKLEEMIPAPAEVERNIRNVVEGEKA
jgi:hypothetical protein